MGVVIGASQRSANAPSLLMKGKEMALGEPIGDLSNVLFYSSNERMRWR